MKRYFLSFVWACLLTTNVYAQGHAAESAAVAERVKTVTIVGNQKMIFGPTYRCTSLEYLQFDRHRC